MQDLNIDNRHIELVAPGVRRPAGPRAAHGALLLVCVALLSLYGAFFHYQATRDYNMRYYDFPWRGNWITTPYAHNKTACFRKVIYVTGKVENAYLAIAARNFFRIQINGRSWKPFFGPSSFRTWVQQQTVYTSLGYPRQEYRARIYDISTLLKPGRNVISVLAQTDEANPRLAVQGVVYAGRRQLFMGDGTWKCAPAQQVRGSTRWGLPSFSDADWANAVDTSEPIRVAADGDVDVFDKPLTGALITADQSDLASRLRFTRDFAFPGRVVDGWIRISSTARYDIYCDGRHVGGTSIIPRYTRPFYGKRGDVEALGRIQYANLIVQYIGAKTTRRTDVYLLKDLFKKGTNRIQIVLHGRETPERRDILAFNLDGRVRFEDGTSQSITTDRAWRVQRPDRGSAWTTAQVLAVPRMSYARYAAPRIRGKIDSGDAMYERILRNAILLCATCLLLLYIQARVTERVARTSDTAVVRRMALLCLAPALAVSGAMLMKSVFASSPQAKFLETSLFAWIALASAAAAWCASFVAALYLARRPTRERTAPAARTAAVATRSTQAWAVVRQWADRYGYAAAIALIVLGAFFMVTHALGADAYLADEYVSMYAAQGIQRTGIPIYANTGFIYTRSAVFHYLLALFMILGGGPQHPMSTRFLAGTWHLALIPLVYLFARELKGRPAGVIAAVLVAFSPYMIFYAREVRFYTQFAFFTTLTFYLLLRSLRNPERAGYRPGVALAFCGAYLSQQFSFTMIPIVLLMIVLSGQMRAWLRPRVLPWMGLVAAVMIVDFVLYMRYCQSPLPYVDIESVPLMALHTDTLEVLPSLLLSNYERAQWLLGVLYVGGLAYTLIRLFRTSQGQNDIRTHGWGWWNYLYLASGGMILFQTIITPRPSSRYIVHLVPLVVVTVACLLARIGEWLHETTEVLSETPAAPRQMQALYSVAVFLVCLAAYRPARVWNACERSINRDTTRAARYVARHLQPGDKVMFASPEIALVELGRCDYMWRPRYGSIFKYLAPDGRLRERNSGAIVVDNADKLRQVVSDNRRVWLVIHTGSMGLPSRDANGQTAQFLLDNFQTVYEPFNMQVMLWDKGREHYRNSVYNHGYEQFNF